MLKNPSYFSFQFKITTPKIFSLLPPLDARLFGFEFVAEMERCTPLCDGLWAVGCGAPPTAGWPIFLKDRLLPLRLPSLSGYKTHKRMKNSQNKSSQNIPFTRECL